MTALPALPDLAALSAQAAQSATAALQSDTPDMFDNLWVKLANITGHPTPAPTATAPITSTAPSSPSSTAAAPTSTPKAQGGGVLGSLESWALGLVTPTGDQGGGLSLEDLVFIVLGVLLIAAAVFSFVFTFDQAKGVGKEFIKGAVEGGKAAALAA